jgi:acetyl esterase/lipase
MTSVTRTGRVVLEKAAQEFADETNRPPYLFQLPPERARQVVEDSQSGADVAKALVSEEWIQVHGGPTGVVPVRIVKPADATGVLPVILHLHGGGWVLSGAHTHDRLVRELAARTHAAVVFPDYDRSPEAKYPTAIEQCYAVAQWVVRDGDQKHLDARRLVLVGDSVGGTIAIALSLMAKQRGDVRLAGQVLFYPPTDAGFDTDSYHHFAEGYFLRRDAMKWFWDQYTTGPDQRAQLTASPLRATLDQLRGLPPTMLFTAEADVVRDEGEAFAARLREADVAVTAVRLGGIIHDFAMLDALRDTTATRAAMDLATSFLRRILGTARWPLDGC